MDLQGKTFGRMNTLLYFCPLVLGYRVHTSPPRMDLRI